MAESGPIPERDRHAFSDSSDSKRYAPPLAAVFNITPPQTTDEKAQHQVGGEAKGSSADWWIAGATIVLALITAALAFFTYRLWQSTKALVEESGRTARTELRAYVKMSHVSPGVTFSGGAVRTTTEIKNYGSTPANISDVSLAYKIVPLGASLSPTPEYEETPGHNVPKAFLVKGENFFATTAIEIGAHQVASVQASECALLAIGYVDYRDQFGVRHRAGNARQYDPRGGEQNLSLFTQPGYNYDRPRKVGEGNDWDDEPGS